MEVEGHSAPLSSCVRRARSGVWTRRVRGGSRPSPTVSKFELKLDQVTSLAFYEYLRERHNQKGSDRREEQSVDGGCGSQLRRYRRESSVLQSRVPPARRHLEQCKRNAKAEVLHCRESDELEDESLGGAPAAVDVGALFAFCNLVPVVEQRRAEQSENALVRRFR